MPSENIPLNTDYNFRVGDVVYLTSMPLDRDPDPRHPTTNNNTWAAGITSGMNYHIQNRTRGVVQHPFSAGLNDLYMGVYVEFNNDPNDRLYLPSWRLTREANMTAYLQAQDRPTLWGGEVSGRTYQTRGLDGDRMLAWCDYTEFGLFPQLVNSYDPDAAFRQTARLHHENYPAWHRAYIDRLDVFRSRMDTNMRRTDSTLGRFAVYLPYNTNPGPSRPNDQTAYCWRVVRTTYNRHYNHNQLVGTSIRAAITVLRQYEKENGGLCHDFDDAENLPNFPEWEHLAEALNCAAKRKASARGNEGSNYANNLFQDLNALTEREDLYDYIHTCDDCSAFMAEENETRSEWHDVAICVACRDQNYSYSEIMEDYVLSDRTDPWYNSARAAYNRSGDDVVVTLWAERNDHYRVEDGWCDRETYYEYQDAYGDDDEYDDDDSQAPHDGLNDYHSGRPHNFFAEVTDPKSPYPALGVELEVYCEDYRAQAVEDIKSLGFLCERDGSLSERYGFEVISKPFGKTEWKAQAVNLLEACQDNEVKGYNAPTDDGNMYGIHVTVHRRHLSSLAEARLMLFLCAEENANFVRAVAQRMRSYGSPSVDMGKLDPEHTRVQYINNGGLSTESNHSYLLGQRYDDPNPRRCRKIFGMGKYSPINLKENLAEFRLFQSTTHLPSFMKNLEFVWALVEWTNPITATGSSWHHEDFVRWLAARPQARKVYPNLVEYLLRKQYVVKGGSRHEPIVNTWLPIMLAGMRRAEALGADDLAQSEAADPMRDVETTPAEPEQHHTAATPVTQPDRPTVPRPADPNKFVEDATHTTMTLDETGITFTEERITRPYDLNYDSQLTI